MKYLLGVDLGTTNIKGTLFNDMGGAISSASRNYETYHNAKNYAEQNPNDWWDSAVSLFKEITENVDDLIRENIKGICISSQTPTLLPISKEGKPLRNAIIWMDRRADEELEEILNIIGEDKYISITGMLPDVSFLPPKLLWYKKNEPENYEKTKCFLQANSYINYKLTGNLSADMDQASLSQCLDSRTSYWSEEIGEVIEIDFNKYFPKLMKNNEIIGYVTEEASNLTGLKIGIPVVAGTSDAIAAMYASGISKLGEATEVCGTSSLVFAGTEKLPTDYHTVGGHRCTLDGIPYVYNAPISSTGASIKWYLKNLGHYEHSIAKEQDINIYNFINQEAAHARPGCNGLIFFPYMMGERAPLWNNHARGMFIGLTIDSKKEEIMRSIFEGTSFALKTVIDEFKRNGTKIDCLRVVGGGSLSETWLKIKASILNIPVMVLDKKTGDVPFGDALIAGQAIGLYPNLSKSIKELITVEKVIEPNSEWVEVYDKIYPFFKKFYNNLDEDLKKLDLALKCKNI